MYTIEQSESETGMFIRTVQVRHEKHIGTMELAETEDDGVRN